MRFADRVQLERKSRFLFVDALLRSWRIIALTVLLLDLLVFAESEDNDSESPKKIPCPENWDPSPCACYETVSSTSLFCENLSSTEDLRNIFKCLSKETRLSEFRMHNSNVTSLPAGVFGKASFAAIQIHGTALTCIDDGAFEGSENTLSAIALWQNELNHINYASLRGLKHLSAFYISSEKITGIPDDAFANLPTLAVIEVVANNIETIGNQAFANLSNLRDIIFTNNRVPIIKVGEFAFSNPEGRKFRRFVFSRNNLTEAAFSENSLRGLNTSFVDLQGNQLQYLHQNVFENMIQTISERPRGVIMGFGNPVKCDQSMKWLIDKPLKFKKTLVGFECPNKKLVSEINDEDLTP